MSRTFLCPCRLGGLCYAYRGQAEMIDSDWNTGMCPRCGGFGQCICVNRSVNITYGMMTDQRILELYRLWSEEFYYAQFMHPSPELVQGFREWLRDEHPDHTPVTIGYELEMLAEFHKQEKES